jgi:uncharacterized protein YndB with AHSA1/START domain
MTSTPPAGSQAPSDLDLEASIEVDAPPERVWAVVSDLARMGEWSPECRRMIVLGRPRVGAQVIGVNRRGLITWPTTSTITRLEPGRVIAWRVRENGAEWSYELHPIETGTRLVERRTLAPGDLTAFSRLFTRVFLGGVAAHDEELLAGMRASLARIRTAVDRG